MRIVSFNARAKLGEDSDAHMHNLTSYLLANQIDFCLLQEVGRLLDYASDSVDILNGYDLILSTGANAHESVGFLIRNGLTRCVINKRSKKFKGRLFHITVKLPNFVFNLVNVYMPSGIEQLSPNNPKVHLARDIADEIIHILGTFPNVLVGGDFNEVRTDSERTGVFGKPKVLPRLIGRAGFIDLSSRSRKHTWYDSRGFGSSKLDRFLGSKAIAKRTSNYRVDDNILVGSDHRLIHLEIRSSKPYVPKRDRPKYYRLNADLLSKDQIARFRSSVGQAVSDLYGRLMAEPDHVFTTSAVVLDSYIESFVDMIHSHYWRVREFDTRTPSKRVPRGTLLDIKQGKKFSLKFSADRKHKVIRTPDSLQILESRIRDLRKLKFDISRSDKDKALSDILLARVRILLMGRFDNYSTDPTVVGQIVRKEIRATQQKIQKALDKHNFTSRRQRDKLFSSKRKRFYSKHVWGKEGSYSDISIIRDKRINKIVTDKTSVQRALIREAKDLLSNPTPAPTNPDDWFRKLYEPGSAVGDIKDRGFTWDNLIEPFTFAEIKRAVSTKPNSSPGFDGMGKKILRLLFYDDNGYLPALPFVHRILTLWFKYGSCPEWAARGVICLLGKPGKESSPDYKDKRPITLLPDLGKIPMKIFADRFQDIYAKWPSLMMHAQNGFLREGGCDICLRFLFDRIRDYNKNQRMLFLLFIDASKAFDKIQFWHIEATLRRFSFPETFITFLMSYYRAGQSCFRTAWGKTSFFNITNSVRQGDPLSPIIYILCMDAYHTRMRDLGLSASVGVTWDRDNHHLDTTIGLADDCAGMCSTVAGVILFWKATVEFYDLHGWKLNAGKTEARFNRWVPQSVINELQASPVWGSNRDKVVWKGPGVAFRYLGLMVRLDLSWVDHKVYIEKTKLYPLWRSIKLGQFSLEQAVFSYSELMLSVIAYTTKFYAVDLGFISYWNRLFLSALKTCGGLSPGRISQHALYHYFNTFHLEHFIAYNYISDYYVHLNSMRKLWHCSTRVALAEHPNLLQYERFSRTEPLSNINPYLRRYKIHLFVNPDFDGDFLGQYDRTDTPSFSPSRRFPRPLDRLGATFYSRNFHDFTSSANDQTIWSIWTDGSYKDDFTGWSCVLYRSDSPDHAIARGGFSNDSFFDDIRAYGGELCAATAGYLATGITGRTVINHTDCNSMVQAVRAFSNGTQRERIRSAGRPFVRAIARARDEFPDRSVQLYVRSHQDESTDVRHKRNHIADKHANIGRSEAQERNIRINLRHLDLPIGLSYNGLECIGDPFASSRAHFRKIQMNLWHASDSCGRLIRLDKQRLSFLLRHLRRNCKTTYYSNFMIDSLLYNLPHDQCLSIARDFSHNCALCGSYCADDDLHYMTCDFVSSDKNIFSLFNTVPLIHPFRGKFRHVGVFLHQKLKAIVHRTFNLISEKRQYPDVVVKTLVFTYLSELSVRRTTFDIRTLHTHIQLLPKRPRFTPRQISQIDSDLAQSIFDSRRIPLDFIVVTDLAYLPSIFCRWHFVSSRSYRATVFGEVCDIECSHHDLTFWFVVSGPCADFYQAIDIAYGRLRIGGRTWFFHEPVFHFGRWGRPAPSHCEILSFPVGDLRVTVIQRKILDSVRFFSYPARILRSSDLIINMRSDLLLLPFLGFGRFNHIIPRCDIPISMILLIQDLRSHRSVDFMLGFFSKKLRRCFSSSECKLLREILFQKAVPILRLVHRCRLDWYLFLRKRYNLFPPSKRISEESERNPNPANRKRNSSDDRPERAKRLCIKPSLSAQMDIS